MNDKLKASLDLFLENTQSIKKNFVWHDTLIKRLAALIYTAENKKIDCDAIRECYALIKKKTGVFSSFRGNLAISTSALLSLSGDSESQLSNTLAVYNIMKELKFRPSDYLVAAAYQIASHGDNAKYQETAERARDFYDGMKENHWFHTGSDDYMFAAMLGLSDIGVNAGVARMEQLHERLKHEFHFGNSIQALTQVLVLGGETNKTSDRLLGLREEFRNRKLRLDKEYTLSSLGVLSLLPADIEAIVNDVSESYNFLRSQKDFSFWSSGKQELLLFSAALVAFIYADYVKMGVLTTTLSTNITNIVIAQHAAIAAATASSAAAASSH